jgi:hypothetical protein
MGRFWAFCLEPDHNANNGNFSTQQTNPPNRGVFWVTGDVAGAGPFTFSNETYFAADDPPTLYDGDNVFYAISRFGMPAGQGVQDIIVALGRIRNVPPPGAPATVGSPVNFPAAAGGRPKCIVNKAAFGGNLTTITLPLQGGGNANLDAIGPIVFHKDPGGNRPKKSSYEALIIAQVGTGQAPNPVTAEFAFDPEVDVDNGL